MRHHVQMTARAVTPRPDGSTRVVLVDEYAEMLLSGELPGEVLRGDKLEVVIVGFGESICADHPDHVVQAPVEPGQTVEVQDANGEVVERFTVQDTGPLDPARVHDVTEAPEGY